MQKISLKVWDDAVAEELHLALRDEELYKYITGFPARSAAEFCARHRPDRVGAALVLSAHLPDEEGETAVGLVSVRTEAAGHCHLGYMLARAHWGHGLGKAMVALALDEISARLGPQTVVANVDSENHASRRLLESLGFKEVRREETTLKFQPSVDVVLQRSV